MKPTKTALLLIDFQNEFASKGRKLFENVKGVMESTQMLHKTIDLASLFRKRMRSSASFPCARHVGWRRIG